MLRTADREFVDEFFAKSPPGKFLDIGAFDGVTDSLTAGLVERGWEGVMVEPAPKNFLKLLANHGGNPRLKLMNAAISDHNEFVLFWSCLNDGEIEADSGQRGSIVESFVESNINEGKAFSPPAYIYTVCPEDILNIFGGAFRWHFVSIDAEGMSGRILNALPLRHMVDLRLLCVEFEDEGMIEIARRASFRLIRRSEVNLFFAR